MRLTLVIFIVIVLYYVFFGVYLYLNQRKYIYFPDPDADFYDCPLFYTAEKIDFQGTRFYYKHDSEKILVHYHGNADTACNAHGIKEILDELEYSYIFVEYSGYAGDTRKPTKALILQDARNIHEFLKTKRYQELVLMGESLGTGVASYHASLTKADKVLLVSPFDRLSSIAKKQHPLYPVRWLLAEEYDSVSWLQKQRGELLVIHGTQEDIVPIHFGAQLFREVDFAKKEFVEIVGAGHNDIYTHKKALDVIKEFLKTI